MRKQITFLLAIGLLASLCGCGKAAELTNVAETARVESATQIQTESITEEQVTETESEPNTTESTPETTETETISETAASETETKISETESLQMDGVLSHDEIVQTVSAVFQKNNSLAEIRYDDAEQAYIISMWEDGFGEITDKFNNFSEGWDDVKNTALGNYRLYYDIIHEVDSQTPVIMNLVDDRNHDKKIISVRDNQIIYDIMNEKSPDEFRQATVDSLNQQFQESGKNAQATYSTTEQAYIISTWYDGLGETIETEPINGEKWNSQKDLFRVMYDSIRAILQSSSDNTPLIMKVVDDRNHDKDLVIIKNSEIIYDILAE